MKEAMIYVKFNREQVKVSAGFSSQSKLSFKEFAYKVDTTGGLKICGN
jgi:hypothetical protein